MRKSLMICGVLLAAQMVNAHPVGGGAKKLLPRQGNDAPAIDLEPDEMDAPNEPWETIDIDVDEEADEAERERQHQARMHHAKTTHKQHNGDMISKLHAKVNGPETVSTPKPKNPVVPQPAEQQQPQEVPEEEDDDDAAIAGLHRAKGRHDAIKVIN
eukprot:gnl/MRDRNA2_/MRDRNA2_94535_c0_seq1.p1 gnl/MRDRNA2_/MRDRNA2_94535_c0~~gnl/MRDRNA2_/MRDRNA2_94535_c0_seq1.p1  ORF type:complete len:157 (-),score=52.39 gnl/MRDRNA2_/MRDRNA2_94535_c0_seq1:104-574(-)